MEINEKDIDLFPLDLPQCSIDPLRFPDLEGSPVARLALQILESPQPLDLLITDVVMPDRVNGFALARMARMRRLDLKILYVSAYELPTEEAIGKILRKPIAPDALVVEAGLALAAPGDASAG